MWKYSFKEFIQLKWIINEPSGDEDPDMWSKAPKHLQDGPCGAIVYKVKNYI